MMCEGPQLFWDWAFVIGVTLCLALILWQVVILVTHREKPFSERRE